MSTREKLIKARLGMLALAEELQNISLVCRKAGISRSHFYEIKEAYEKWGAEGLVPQLRRKPRMPNQTPHLTVGQMNSSRPRDLRQMPLLYLVQHLQAVPFWLTQSDPLRFHAAPSHP
jgi:hypothetical protein